MAIVELRPELHEFAQLMESRLREHDEQQGDTWKTAEIVGLLDAALAKWQLADRARRRCGDPAGRTEARKHLADLAAYAMFAAHAIDRLELAHDR